MELSWTEWLSLAVAIVLLVVMIRTILDDLRRAKDPSERMAVVPQEYGHLMSLEEKKRYADWYFRWSTPKRLAGLFIAVFLWILLKQYVFK